MGKRTSTAYWAEGKGCWQINVQKDGKRRSFYSSISGRNGQREANAKADAWLDDNIDSGRKRLDALADDYIEELKLRTSQSHWRPEQSRMETWIKPRMGYLRPEAVTEQHCQDVINAAYSEGASKKHLLNIRATMVAFFKYCRKCKVCKFHLEELTIPKGATDKEKSILQPQDIVTLFTSDNTTFRGKIARDDLINGYRLLVVTGLRPGELQGLMRNDVKNGKLHVNRSLNIYNEITTGKNKNAIRSTAMNALTQSIWDAQLELTNDIYPFAGITEKGMLKRWQKYCEVNGVTKTTLYELRHTFISVIQTLPEGYIKNLVGHSKNMDTFGTYAHDMTDTQKDIACAVQKAFDAILKKAVQSST